MFLPAYQFKLTQGQDQMQITRLAADRTVAVFNFKLRRCLYFEFNGTTMTTTLIFHSKLLW